MRTKQRETFDAIHDPCYNRNRYMKWQTKHPTGKDKDGTGAMLKHLAELETTAESKRIFESATRRHNDLFGTFDRVSPCDLD